MDGGVGVLGQDAGLTELFPVSPQVMETRQVPRSPRARLLLLLLLVSWGHRTASGAALPPAGVFRYVGHPGLPGRVRTQRGGERPKENGEQRLRKGEQRPRERTEMGGGQGISKTKRYTRILRKALRDLKGTEAGTGLVLEQRLLGLGVCQACAGRWGRTGASDSVSVLRRLRTW